MLYRDFGAAEAKIENDIGEESKNIFCTYKREKLKDSAGEAGSKLQEERERGRGGWGDGKVREESKRISCT